MTRRMTRRDPQFFKRPYLQNHAELSKTCQWHFCRRQKMQQNHLIPSHLSELKLKVKFQVEVGKKCSFFDNFFFLLSITPRCMVFKVSRFFVIFFPSIPICCKCTPKRVWGCEWNLSVQAFFSWGSLEPIFRVQKSQNYVKLCRSPKTCQIMLKICSCVVLVLFFEAAKYYSQTQLQLGDRIFQSWKYVTLKFEKILGPDFSNISRLHIS